MSDTAKKYFILTTLRKEGAVERTDRDGSPSYFVSYGIAAWLFIVVRFPEDISLSVANCC